MAKLSKGMRNTLDKYNKRLKSFRDAGLSTSAIEEAIEGLGIDLTEKARNIAAANLTDEQVDALQDLIPTYKELSNYTVNQYKEKFEGATDVQGAFGAFDEWFDSVEDFWTERYEVTAVRDGGLERQSTKSWTHMTDVLGHRRVSNIETEMDNIASAMGKGTAKLRDVIKIKNMVKDAFAEVEAYDAKKSGGRGYAKSTRR